MKGTKQMYLMWQMCRVCSEIQVTSAIDFSGRGFDTKIATGFDKPIDYKN